MAAGTVSKAALPR